MPCRSCFPSLPPPAASPFQMRRSGAGDAATWIGRLKPARAPQHASDVSLFAALETVHRICRHRLTPWHMPPSTIDAQHGALRSGGRLRRFVLTESPSLRGTALAKLSPLRFFRSLVFQSACPTCLKSVEKFPHRQKCGNFSTICGNFSTLRCGKISTFLPKCGKNSTRGQLWKNFHNLWKNFHIWGDNGPHTPRPVDLRSWR